MPRQFLLLPKPRRSAHQIVIERMQGFEERQRARTQIRLARLAARKLPKPPRYRADWEKQIPFDY